MAAGTVTATKLMDRIKVVAEAVAALTGRTFQGKKRFSEAENLEELVRALTAETQGYFGFWLGPRIGRKPTERGSVVVNGSLLVSLPKDDTSDVNSAYEVADTLLKALLTQSNFSNIGIGISEGSWEPVSDDLEDGIAEFEFKLTYEAGLC